MALLNEPHSLSPRAIGRLNLHQVWDGYLCERNRETGATILPEREDRSPADDASPYALYRRYALLNGLRFEGDIRRGFRRQQARQAMDLRLMPEEDEVEIDVEV